MMGHHSFGLAYKGQETDNVCAVTPDLLRVEEWVGSLIRNFRGLAHPVGAKLTECGDSLLYFVASESLILRRIGNA